jgi:hypothetical protein
MGILNTSVAALGGLAVAGCDQLWGIHELDGGASFLCDTVSPPPLFCDDFDRGAIAARWPGARIDPAGDAGVDDATAASPPNSALFRLGADAPPTPWGCSFVTIDKDFPDASAEQLHLELDLRLADGNPGIGIFTVKQGFGADLCQLILGASPTSVLEQFQPADGGPWSGAGHSASMPIPVQQWVHMTLDADYGAGTITLRVGDNVVVDHEPMTAACAAGIGQPALSAGIWCQPYHSSAVEFHIDNVVFNAK